ncbi:FMN-binding protein [Derxia lacustris]|uniref:FMN-binding protein n=1 Tax=Derxia lacustris TaxID=764842 RepID=UPI000A172224|nr:FMN-binding protein [Derxia lacustris]
MRFQPFALAAVSAAALLPTAAFAVDYLTPEQAQKALFPDADSFEPRTLALDPARMQALEKKTGLPARSANWTVLLARKAGAPLGWLVFDNVVGKFELITYAVALGSDGAVRQIEILSYRESHGAEVRLPAWRKQFVGKTGDSAIKVGDDIGNISGATLSCTHVTDGVRRIVGLMQLARDGGWLG